MISASRGFTLIELLVVIAIIGLLSSVVVSALNESRVKARITTMRENMHVVTITAEVLSLDQGNYLGLCDIGSSVVNHLQALSDQFGGGMPNSSNGSFFGCGIGGNPPGSEWGVYVKVSDDEFYCIDNGANFAKFVAEADFPFSINCY